MAGTSETQAVNGGEQAKLQAVFSIRQTKNGSIWTRVGTAYPNKDSSLNVVLDSLPVDGRLHIRVMKSESKPQAEAPAAA